MMRFICDRATIEKEYGPASLTEAKIQQGYFYFRWNITRELRIESVGPHELSLAHNKEIAQYEVLYVHNVGIYNPRWTDEHIYTDYIKPMFRNKTAEELVRYTK
jgi:hypothetical protein